MGKWGLLSVVTTNLRLHLARMRCNCIKRRTRYLPTHWHRVFACVGEHPDVGGELCTVGQGLLTGYYSESLAGFSCAGGGR